MRVRMVHAGLQHAVRPRGGPQIGLPCPPSQAKQTVWCGRSALEREQDDSLLEASDSRWFSRIAL